MYYKGLSTRGQTLIRLQKCANHKVTPLLMIQKFIVLSKLMVHIKINMFNTI